ncbi:protocadherin Fat 4-like, partial [Limulus polyphemus]|uniref:Protocadherin Fat 4-like n=1 Tax=Limulus polyphemus TaxID=6850 RepID=A0ABM1B8G1_LIMPO
MQLNEQLVQACQFYPLTENRRFERVSENIPVDQEIFRLQVFPRQRFEIEAVDNSLSDIQYFKYEEIDQHSVAIKVAKSLDDLVDRSEPHSVLKFKLTCKGDSGTEEVFLPVTVYIEDINDHAPQFENTPYHLAVDELTPVGLTIFRGIHAVDRDKPNTANSDVTYSIVGGNEENAFVLSDPIEGILVVNKPLDYDHGIREFKLHIQATDHGSPQSLSTVTTMTIKIKDADDQNPVFTHELYTAHVTETPVITGATRRQKIKVDPPIHAYDLDAGINARMRYKIILGNDEELFYIHEQTGELFLVKEIDLENLISPVINLQIQEKYTESLCGRVTTATVLDYEERQTYDLLIQVSDGQNMAVSPLSVKVVDINDKQPVFTHNYYNFSVFEELQENVSVGTVLAVDGDTGKNAEVRYSIIGNKASSFFHVDQQGNILTRRSLDRETDIKVEFLVIAFDRGIPQLSGTATVFVRVDDINDNAPYFERESYTVLVPEEREPPYKVFEMNAADKDKGDNAIIKYSIVQGNDHQTFEIDEDRGILYTADKLNYEDQQQYTIQITARNLKAFQGPQASTIVNPVVELIVKVQDINDGAVVFTMASYHYGILETTSRGKTVGFVNATNFSRAPRDQDIIYWVGKGNEMGKFWLNPATGALVLMDTIDRDPPANQQYFKLEVFARDTLSINSFNTSVEVKIEVIDVNDNVPVFDEENYSLELPENLSPGTQLPPFYRVLDIDAGNNGNIEKYYTNGSKDTFVVNRTTGSVILVSSLDYEVRDQYKFTVFADDGGNPQRTGSATVVIKVQNINEYTPEFVGLPYDFWAEENAIAGTGIGQVKAFDKDRNNIFYSLSKGDTDFFGIEEDTGRIYVKSDLVSRTQYSLIVQATDDGEPQNNSLGVTVNIFVREVNDHAPIFSQKTYKGFVTEKEATNKVIIQVAATDRDLQNNTVTYSITSGNEEGVFYIDAINGNIRVNRSSAHTLDYDKKKNYVLLVQAKDSHASPLFGLATVVIDIRDTNDHPPVFSKPAYSVSFQENLPAGYCFLTVKADSRDSVDEMKFALDNKNIPFVIDSRSGEVCTKEVLDREQKTSYEFSLFVFDGKFEARAPVTVEVLDENDNAPKFEKTHYVLNIPQESKVGRSIIQIHASDPDADNNGEVTYWIKNTHGLFEIDPQSGLVRLASTLPNYVEKNTSFEMEVYAQDHGIGSNIGKASLIIRISNIQNHQPEFDQFAYMVAVDENVDNIVLLTVHATDTDKGKAGNVVYRILRATRRQVFRIDRQTGAILLVSPLDYEDIKYLELVVEARDKANEPQFSTAIVQITVNDVNDNAPVFLSLPRFLRVPLSTSPSEVIYKVEAVDKDSSVAGNNKINYEISPPSPLFTIESNTGQIIPKQSLSPIIETLNIVAYDSSTVPLSSSTQIVVEVYKDSITELTPVFTSIQYSTEVDNVLEPGETIMRVRAAVPNGDLVWYNITKSNGGKVKEFSIDYETGIIVTTSKLDVQESALYHFLVTATNQNDPRRVAEAGMIVRMSDRNSKCPSFPFSEYYATVKENTPPDSIVLPNIQVEDAEKHRKVSYSITEDNSLENFYVDSRNPLSVFIRVKRPLDRDTMPPILQGIYTLMVTASNQRCASSVKVKILVEDENDNEPVFEKQGYIVEVKENTRRDHVVTQLKASDSDEIDSGKLRYFIIEGDPNNEFQIDEKTGVVSIQVPLDRENTPAYMLRILAVDSANNTGLTSLHVVVLDENDWSPVFFNDTFVLNVTEGPASVGVGIQLYVVDNDEGKNGEMEVYIDEGNSNGIFRLGVKEGKAVLSIRKELDRENYDVQDFATHLVKVAAKDMGIPSRTGTAQVVVLIQDINDNPPQFEKEVYYQFLSESVPVGTVFETVKATDADTANNTNLKYSFAQKHKHIPFEIDPASGTINITRQLDVSEAQEYTLTLEVFDGQWKGIAVLKVIVSEAEERDPRFNQHHYNFAVLENTAGALVGQVKLKPRKHRLNTETVYIIVNSDVKKLFSITEDGHIFTKVGLDRETRSKHTFTVMLEERRPSSKVSISEVSVEVLDVNDQIPTFLQSYQGSIKENVPSGTPVNIHPLVSAVDNDSGNNSVIHYSLSGQGSELFHIEDNGVVLFLPKDSQVVLDREKNELYKLQVIATDLGNLSSSTFLTIRVEDENDNAPRFQHGPLFVKLPETAKPGSKVVEVTAVDADATGINSKIEYVITAGGSNDIRIDRITGEIYVVGYLSPETFYFLNITAVDGKGLGSSTFVNITVTDVNDHRPTFVKPDYMFKIQEGDFREQRWKVGVLHAVDQDTGKNGLVDYNLMMAFNEDFPFVVDVHTGELFVKGVIDRETQPSFIFAVMALDYGEPPLNSTVNVTIEVQDINDEQPKFLTDPYLAEVPENQDPGLK